METSNRGKEIKTLQVKDFICIVDVKDLRSLGYWLNTSVSICFQFLKLSLKYIFKNRLLSFPSIQSLWIAITLIQFNMSTMKLQVQFLTRVNSYKVRMKWYLIFVKILQYCPLDCLYVS